MYLMTDTLDPGSRQQHCCCKALASSNCDIIKAYGQQLLTSIQQRYLKGKERIKKSSNRLIGPTLWNGNDTMGSYLLQ